MRSREILNLPENNNEISALVFKNRGLLLALPAVVLAVFGKPSAFSVAVGLPVAFAGELLRCWAVGYSGETTRHDEVTAPKLVTGGPYGHVRNPLYLGNFITAAGFSIAFTGSNPLLLRTSLIAAALGSMAAVYSIVIPHEQRFLRLRFGETYVRYSQSVPPIFPRLEPSELQEGTWQPSVIARAETKTFLIFGVMLAALAVKAFVVR